MNLQLWKRLTNRGTNLPSVGPDPGGTTSFVTRITYKLHAYGQGMALQHDYRRAVINEHSLPAELRLGGTIVESLNVWCIGIGAKVRFVAL